MGKSHGGLAPDSLVEDEAAVLEDMRRLITQYHDPGRLVSCGMRHRAPHNTKSGLHTSYDVSKVQQGHEPPQSQDGAVYPDDE